MNPTGLNPGAGGGTECLNPIIGQSGPKTAEAVVPNTAFRAEQVCGANRKSANCGLAGPQVTREGYKGWPAMAPPRPVPGVSDRTAAVAAQVVVARARKSVVWTIRFIVSSLVGGPRLCDRGREWGPFHAGLGVDPVAFDHVFQIGQPIFIVLSHPPIHHHAHPTPDR